MAKFAIDHEASSARTHKRADTVNKAGSPAFAQSDKMKLVSILLTSFVKDQYYRSESGTLKELTELIRKVDPKFSAKAAVYARNEFGMRSISHVVGGEIPALVKGEKWTKDFIDRVIHRPDDATEILAYYLTNHGKPVPNSLKKGLAKGLQKFDGYQLAKYRGDKNAVSLVDVVNLVHIKPTEKNAEALAKLIDGELKSEGTWEARISAAGKSENKETAKAEAWADLINSGKIGQFALLRNLRNIYNATDAATMDKALKLLVNEKRIKGSLILPFRYATALNESGISDTRVTRALNKALDISVSAVPKLDGKTVLAIDHSGSMGHGPGSPKYNADLLAAIMVKAFEADVVVFGSNARYVPNLNPDDSTLSLMKQIGAVSHGFATNFPAVYQTLSKKYDRVITLSDMQSWVGYSTPQAAAAEYERYYKAKPFHYNFDLQGYGTTQFPSSRIFELVGFSEKVFEIMGVLEQDKDALIKKIEEIQL